MKLIRIERRERDFRRDGVRVLVGLLGLVFVEGIGPAYGVVHDGGLLSAFLFGCSLGVALSGVFRTTTRQAVVSTLALGVGFALGTIVGVLQIL